MEPISKQTISSPQKAEEGKTGNLVGRNVTQVEKEDNGAIIYYGGGSAVLVSIGFILAILGPYEFYQTYHNHKNHKIQAILFTAAGLPLIVAGMLVFIYYVKRR